MANTKHKLKRSSASRIFEGGEAIKMNRAASSRRRHIILVLKSQKRVNINYSNSISRDELNKKFIKRYKVSKTIKSKIDDFICKYNLKMDSMIEEIGLVFISGSIANLEEAFKVELHEYEI